MISLSACREADARTPRRVLRLSETEGRVCREAAVTKAVSQRFRLPSPARIRCAAVISCWSLPQPLAKSRTGVATRCRQKQHQTFPIASFRQLLLESLGFTHSKICFSNSINMDVLMSTYPRPRRLRVTPHQDHPPASCIIYDMLRAVPCSSQYSREMPHEGTSCRVGRTFLDPASFPRCRASPSTNRASRRAAHVPSPFFKQRTTSTHSRLQGCSMPRSGL